MIWLSIGIRSSGSRSIHKEQTVSGTMEWRRALCVNTSPQIKLDPIFELPLRSRSTGLPDYRQDGHHDAFSKSRAALVEMACGEI